MITLSNIREENLKKAVEIANLVISTLELDPAPFELFLKDVRPSDYSYNHHEIRRAYVASCLTLKEKNFRAYAALYSIVVDGYDSLEHIAAHAIQAGVNVSHVISIVADTNWMHEFTPTAMESV